MMLFIAAVRFSRSAFVFCNSAYSLQEKSVGVAADCDDP